MRRDPAATRVAILTGVVFIPAGLVKFVFHIPSLTLAPALLLALLFLLFRALGPRTRPNDQVKTGPGG